MTLRAIMPVLLDSDSLSSQFLGDIKPGKYSYFAIMIDGTVLAADALVESEIGRIRVSEQGRDVVNVDAAQMLRINRMEGGHVRFESVAGAAGEVCILIPRGYDDANVHLVTEADLAKVAIVHDAAFDTAMSGVIDLYGLLVETGEMNYLLKIIQLDEAIAASAVEKVKISEENAFAIYIERNADWDRFRVLRDNEEVANVSERALTHISDALNETDSLSTANTEGLSTTTNSMQVLRFANPGEVGEFLSDNIQLEVQAGTADTLRIVVFSADFAPGKLRQTKIETASIMERKLARKQKLGRSRPIQSLSVQGE